MITVPKQPSIWTWPATVALAALALGAIWLADAQVHAGVMGRKLNLARIDAIARADRPRIVVLGSSKTRCAVDFDTDMEALLRARGFEAEFVRVTISGAAWPELEPAFAHLTKTPPDLVLVEADLVLFEPHVYRLRGQARPGWAAQVRSDVGFLRKPPKIENLVGAGRSACDLSLYAGGRPISLEEYAEAIRRRRVSTPAERAPFLRALAALQARGARVGLLAEPRSPEAERAFPPALRAEGLALARQLQRDNGLIYLAPVAEMPGDAFIDVGHMNVEGRGRFSAALAERLTGLNLVRRAGPRG